MTIQREPEPRQQYSHVMYGTVPQAPVVQNQHNDSVVEVLVTQPEDLSVTRWTHIIGENDFTHVPPHGLHTAPIHRNKNNPATVLSVLIYLHPP